MKNWRLNNINQSAFEKTGPVPRSITKTFEKFKKELEPNSESEIIEEFRVSRYQTAASIKYLIFAEVLSDKLFPHSGDVPPTQLKKAKYV